jgi:hypothetical protein
MERSSSTGLNQVRFCLHFESAAKSLRYILAKARLRRLVIVTPFAVRMRLVVALVMLFFIYCDFFYFALDSYLLRKLTVAFNASVRYVYHKRLFDHISDTSDLILGCSLLTYMKFRLACFMFSLVTGGRPRYLSRWCFRVLREH